MRPEIKAFFDEQTFTITYLVSDPKSRKAVVIDSVLDFDPKAARTSTASAERVLAAAREKGLSIEWALETHAHADHLSAAPFFRQRTGARIAIGEHIIDVQNVFRPIFGAGDIRGDGTPFDKLLRDGEALKVGGIVIEVLYTPGHTPACVSYKIGDNVFVGDTLFMPDYGTARADFPGGNARNLYKSIKRILSLPPETTLWMCHDYKAPGRETFAWRTTVTEERAKNVQVHDGVTEEAFVALREARDRSLGMPALILPSIQVNIRAGEMPPPADDGNIYLKLPVNRF
jgi:glyoxylase-like metal-dependent hydrolase (beta-lactamase superfamily II)